MKEKNTEEEFQAGVAPYPFPKYFPLIFPEMAIKPEALFEKEMEILEEIKKREEKAREKRVREEKRGKDVDEKKEGE